MDACVAATRGTLPDAGPSRCEAARLKAAGRKAKSILYCNSKAASNGTVVSPGCTAKAKSKFSSSFTKVSGCTGDDPFDEELVENVIDGRCVARLGADPNGLSMVGNICTASCGVVPFPPCSVQASACGSCGDGVCVSHCPGGELVCVSNGTYNTEGCSADSECTAVGDACLANGVENCGTGVVNGCAAPCP